MKVLIIVAAIIFYVAFCIANYIFAKRKYKKFADTNILTARQIIIVNVLTSMFSFVSLIVNYLAYKQLKKKFSC